jgi:hypothetical protein
LIGKFIQDHKTPLLTRLSANNIAFFQTIRKPWVLLITSCAIDPVEADARDAWFDKHRSQILPIATAHRAQAVFLYETRISADTLLQFGLTRDRGFPAVVVIENFGSPHMRKFPMQERFSFVEFKRVRVHFPIRGCTTEFACSAMHPGARTQTCTHCLSLRMTHSLSLSLFFTHTHTHTHARALTRHIMMSLHLCRIFDINDLDCCSCFAFHDSPVAHCSTWACI